ncbi:MAG: asparagine--tRNA ligase [Nanoarchaeota archaeon]|nr:asparagine--tRNA ligase [Nanoarchaeota archaeon]
MFNQVSEVVKKKEGKFAVRGWIHRRRDQKSKIFIILRDSTGTIQCVFDQKFEKQLKGVGIESSIKIWGEASEDKRAPSGVELIAFKLEVVCPTEIFPIAKDLSEEFLLDVRHLWLRSGRMTAILKIRDEIFHASRQFFKEESFYEVSAPMFVSQAGEEGSTMFELEYFGKKVFLSQTGQLHLEAAMFGLEKVYSFGPSFRAEKSRTRRHVTEFWHLEGEMAWFNQEMSMDLQERLVQYIANKVYKNCKKELKTLNKEPKELLEFQKRFARMTYEQAVKDLKKTGFKIKIGDDLGTREEKKLAEKHGPVFVMNYPKKMKAFYMKEHSKNPKLVLCSDLILPGVGEVIGASERETDYEKLVKRIKQAGDDPKNYEWYLDLRKYGSVPHSGFGLGMARLIMCLTGVEHIRDVIPFPRTMTRTYP